LLPSNDDELVAVMITGEVLGGAELTLTLNTTSSHRVTRTNTRIKRLSERNRKQWVTEQNVVQPEEKKKKEERAPGGETYINPKVCVGLTTVL